MYLKFVPFFEIEKILKKKINFFDKLDLVSSILRLNVLYSIQKAGSGHIGSSLSSLDIFLCCAQYLKKNKGNFFSSKGHDAPALYSVLAVDKKIDFKKLHLLRRLRGLPGHPDNKTDNIIFNTGSLGMGISKINGLNYAGLLKKKKEKNIVILGDGELQEGQNWEALMFLQNQKKISPLIIIDNNKIQSDTWIEKVKDYSKLKSKIQSFGLNFKEIDGHNKLEIFTSIKKHFKTNNGATVILANTIKGKGFSKLESTNFNKNLNFYPYHSGILEDKTYNLCVEEILQKIYKFCKKKKITSPNFKKVKVNKDLISNDKLFNLIPAYSDELLAFTKKNKNAIVLDSDLTKDTGNSSVMLNMPNQFIEFGIAEQDMVSFGSGLAAKKLLPIFHSFSCFLSTRAQEQIFNFCSENRKGIFVGALSGLLPAGPGHSHQMVRDIPLIGSLPNMILIELFSKKMIKEFFSLQKKIKKSIFIKFNNINLIEKNFKNFSLPKLGNFLKIFEGRKTETIIVCQGADILNEVLKIKTILKNKKNLSLFAAVWLNDLNKNEIKKINNKNILVIQSSTNFGSYASFLASNLLKYGCKVGKFKTISIEGIPECGHNDEILEYHKLSSSYLLKQIEEF